MEGASHHQLSGLNLPHLCERDNFLVGQEGVVGFMLQVESDGPVQMRRSHLNKHLLVHPHVEDSRSRDEESGVEGRMKRLFRIWSESIVQQVSKCADDTLAVRFGIASKEPFL